MFRRILLLLGLVAIATLLIPFLGVRFFNTWLNDDISGWLQVGIALVTLPIILYELDQIRRTVNQKPEIEIGVVSVDELPFSKVRSMLELPITTTVSTGYPHFYIVLRNKGTAPARHLKIYVEHIECVDDLFPAPPSVKVSEFSEHKPSFVHEHNFDFVFRAGPNWIINPDDIEPFGFHATTNVLRNQINSAGYKHTVPEFPPYSTVILDCTIWAEGLNEPTNSKLTIKISQTNIDKDKDNT